jgi:hypothetical protein
VIQAHVRNLFVFTVRPKEYSGLSKQPDIEVGPADGLRLMLGVSLGTELGFSVGVTLGITLGTMGGLSNEVLVGFILGPGEGEEVQFAHATGHADLIRT